MLSVAHPMSQSDDSMPLLESGCKSLICVDKHMACSGSCPTSGDDKTIKSSLIGLIIFTVFVVP